MADKRTKKDNYNDLLAIPEIAGNEELVTFIKGEIELLDKRAEKAKQKAEEDKKNPDELKVKITEVLNDTDFTTVGDIVTLIGVEDVTPAKVVARLSQLVKDQVVVKEEIKGEKGKVMGYKLIG